MIQNLSLAIVILAAGASTRLGFPKQLVKYSNYTLLQNVINIVENVNLKPSILILGANAEKIKQEISFNNLLIYENTNWQKGISTSIKLGLEMALMQNENLDNILFLVCDQLFLSKEIVNNLIYLHSKNLDITCCRYKNDFGIPAIFNKKYFNELFGLKNDFGAKSIMKKYPNNLTMVEFDEGEIDIDTESDLRKWIG